MLALATRTCLGTCTGSVRFLVPYSDVRAVLGLLVRMHAARADALDDRFSAAKSALGPTDKAAVKAWTRSRRLTYADCGVRA